MAPIKIIGSTVSTCTMRVLCTLYEKEMTDFEVESIDFTKGEHKAPAHLAKQPFGQVPVMEDGDLSIFESRAISRYICNKYVDQGTDLLGSTLAEKAIVDQWLEAEHANYHPPISAIVWEKVFGKSYGLPTNEERVGEMTLKLAGVLDVYEQVLAKQPYLAGEKFTLADLSHLPYGHYLINMTDCGEVLTSRPNVKAWWERISARPSWQKVLALGKH